MNTNRRTTLSSSLLLLLLVLLIASAIAVAETFARLERYAVNTTISNRFARTVITVDVVNERECASLLSLNLQLPLNVRVRSLAMDLSDDCSINGEIKPEAEAQAEFQDKVEEGSPGALLQAYDFANYGVQISIPALGTTRVELVLEELLHRRGGKIDVSIPIFPGIEVEELVMDVTIQEHGILQPLAILNSNEGINEFLTETRPGVNDTDVPVSAHLEALKVPASGRISEDILLPAILRGSYDVEALPEEGVIIPNEAGQCFVYLFNPSRGLASPVVPLPRNVVFGIDVSGSMEGQKLDDAKAAFVAILDKLNDRDTFAIQSFADKKLEDYFGPSPADENSKEDAKDWVNGLRPFGGTDIESAFIDGISRVQAMQAAPNESADNAESIRHVPIVILLTDAQPSTGSMDSAEIARRVKDANTEEGVENAKLYSLAFGDDADFSLLSGISIQNGGKAIRIFENFGDAAAQIKEFFDAELDNILASDLNVYFAGDVRLDSQTLTSFSVYPEGSEIAIWAITREDETMNKSTNLQATTFAYTHQGLRNWTVDLDVEFLTGERNSNSACFQSFAHAKISEILLFREATETLGKDMSTYATYYLMGNAVAWNTAGNFGADGRGGSRTRYLQQSDYDPLVGRAEAQALNLALEAGIVWPGLTAMVTRQSATCTALADLDEAVCAEGDPISLGFQPPPLSNSDPDDSSAAVACSSSFSRVLFSALFAWSIHLFVFSV